MSIYWKEETASAEPVRVPDNVLDLNFRIACRSLPIDHAHALRCAVAAALPWMEDEPRAATHTIHGAESGNGWMRPDEQGGVIHLSRRTRLSLRLPKTRIDDARVLEGRELEVMGSTVSVGRASVRPLSRETTLFARYLVTPGAGENTFLEHVAQMLHDANITAGKIMSGREHTIATPERMLNVRSLMVGGLSFEDSMHLQEQGMGREQKLGCGIFLPHKGIGAVYNPQG